MEFDIIGYLVGVEEKASTLLDDAKKEARHRLDMARVSADNQYKTEYEKIILQLEKDYNLKKNQLLDSHKNELQEYREEIESHKKDIDGFYQLLDDLLLKVK
ncbi:MAG TPA: hypothetical protein VFC68_05085 [Treponemataceae bacterium]|nr:hypothetical protein [Treponemataceae bacterium]